MALPHPTRAGWRTILWIFIPLYLLANGYLLAIGETMRAVLWLAMAALLGFAYGLIFQRTRNLAASSVAHVAMNVLGQSLG